MKGLGLDEQEFYEHYGSFDGIESTIWNEYMEETITAVTGEKIYQQYSSRERLLAFYYTLIERLKKDRSYVKYTVETKLKKTGLNARFPTEISRPFYLLCRSLNPGRGRSGRNYQKAGYI